MRTRLSLLTATFLLCAPAARAERGSSRGRRLVHCDPILAPEAPDAGFAQNLNKRFADVKVNILGKFRGYYLTRNGQKRYRTISLPELKHGVGAWRIEEIKSNGASYFLYDVGPRNLEHDQLTLDSTTLALLQGSPAEGARLESSKTRQRDLSYLSRFQQSIARAVYDVHQKTLANDPGAPTREIYGNADLFAIFNTRLKPSASARKIASHLELAAKVTYAERRSFVLPSFRGLAQELGFAKPGELSLPFLNRVKQERAQGLLKDFVASFDDAPGCELGTLHSLNGNTSERLRLTILLKAYRNAQKRGCKTMVTSMAGKQTIVELYGFYFWKNVTLRDGRREDLYVLQVNTPDFNRGFSRLARRLQELDQ